MSNIVVIINTLKDFENTKIEIHNNVSILKNEHQYVSKTCFKFYAKIINDVRATVYQIAIPSDSKVAI